MKNESKLMNNNVHSENDACLFNFSRHSDCVITLLQKVGGTVPHSKSTMWKLRLWPAVLAQSRQPQLHQHRLHSIGTAVITHV